MRNPAHRWSRYLAITVLVGSGFGLLAFALAPRPAEEDQDVQRQRQQWFYRQRAFPHRYVPSGAHQRALRQLTQQLTEEEAARALSPQTPTGPTPSWTFIGPAPIQTPYSAPIVSGRVTGIAVDPNNANTVYLGSAQGGIWKTINGGTNWTPLTDTQASTAIGSIALDPTNSNIIYAGTGEENFSGDSYYGAGILKSTDAGANWTQICGPFCGPLAPDGYFGGGARIGGLAVNPANSQILLAAVALLFQDGVYRSTNGGTTWTQVLTGNPANSVMFDPSNANVAYASLGNAFSGGTEGVFRSTNSGQTWTAVNGTGANMLNLTNAGRVVLAMAPSVPSTLYVGISNVTTGGLLGFYKTTDSGTNWTRLTTTPDYCTPQCWYDHVIAVQPTNPNVVFAGGAFTTTLVRSTDGGSSWATLQSAQNFGFLHADMHALMFSPSNSNMLYLGNDGGAYVTTQAGAANPAFTGLNSTLGITQFYPGLSIHPTNPNSAIGGTQDNGTLIYSGAQTWNDVVCGDGSYTAIDFVTPATMYAACQQISIFKSTSSGMFGSWNSAQSGINTGDRVDFIPPLVMDPSNSQTLYFGTYRVYRTANGASSWTAISPDLTGGDPFFGVLTTIAVAPNNSNTVYVGTMDNRVQVTTNASAGSPIWTNITAGLPPRVVTHVAVDPTSSTTAYVTSSGFTGFGDSLGHVFKTTNGGSSWTDISSNLPNTPANFLVVVPDAPNVLFVGTDVGVFYTTTGGSSWTSLVNGLPRIAVVGLTLHNSSRTLRASTHGRGAWDINFASLLAPVAQSAVSRKMHGGAGSFDVDLPLTGTTGVECRIGGGATNDFTMVVTFSGNVTVTGSPQAQVTMGTGTIGSGGVSNGGMVTVAGNTVTIPLTNVADQQTINVTLNGVNSASIDEPAATVVIPMSRLLGDTNGNRAVNASDVSLTKGRIGQAVNATNFRSDVNANGAINAGDASLVKASSGHAVP